MTGFAADWLALREPYDKAARDPTLLAALAAWTEDRPSLRVVDLGAGTGSALRSLRPHLPDQAIWTLVEGDPLLIAAGNAQLEPGDRVRYRQAELNRDLETVIGEDLDLVTASALIDLVSDAWLARLAARIRQCRCAAWIGLTYEGSLGFDPPLADDVGVARAFNRDMTRDKGFGVALGAAAHDALAARLEGYGRVMTGQSPWLLRKEKDQALIQALIDGIAEAARAPTSWRLQRQAQTERLCVGHRDLLFLP